MAGKIVVDSSVLIKWIKTRDEDLVDEAHHLLAEVETRSLEVHVSALPLYEVGNIVLLKTRLGAPALDEIFDRLEDLPFTYNPRIAVTVDMVVNTRLRRWRLPETRLSRIFLRRWRIIRIGRLHGLGTGYVSPARVQQRCVQIDYTIGRHVKLRRLISRQAES